MKSRTFKRTVVVAAICSLFILGGLGYFVLRPWQAQRTLNSMRTQGMAAYEAGDMHEAVEKLGRYTRSAESPEAETFLAFARAREMCEVTDFGHIVVAANAYREYLRRVPGDLEAKQELLGLMNMSGMYVEAEAQARELLEEDGVTDLEVLEELHYALVQQQAGQDEIGLVLEEMYGHPDREFHHVLMYLNSLSSRGLADERRIELEQWIAANPTGIEERVQAFLLGVGGVGIDDGEATVELCAIIGLDPETAVWSPEAPALSASASSYVSRLFNSLRRPRLATAVIARSAQENQDIESAVWAARRLYWSRMDDELGALEVMTDHGEPDPDVLGYQMLSAERAGDQGRSDALEARMREIKYDRRALAWVVYIDGVQASDEGRGVDARLALQDAVDWYPAEPTFRLRIGQQRMDEGRFAEAIEQWRIASEVVNGRMGPKPALNSLVVGWVEPMVRIIESYASADRLVEATEYIDELQYIAPRQVGTVMVTLGSKAELAKRGQLSRASGRLFVESYEEIIEERDPRGRASLAPSVVEILVYMDERELASEEIEFAMRVANENADAGLIARLIETDERLGLGVASGLGLDTSGLSLNSPLVAYRRAGQAFEASGELDDGIAVLRAGFENSAEEDRDAWERAIVLFVDEHDTERSGQMLAEMMGEAPNDLGLLFFAIETNAYSRDLEKVEAIIDRVSELTSGQGRAIPSVLRLARANATVALLEDRTRQNRDLAIEIVRSVVSAEPQNTKARNMLGRLLAMPPAPGLAPEDRFEPDVLGAIEQYRSLARDLDGRPAQSYLLESADLAHRRLGDAGLAEELLDEYVAMFGDDDSALPGAAMRYENIGQNAKAEQIYEGLLGSDSSAGGDPAAMLSLAEIRLAQGERGEALALLAGVQAEDRLNARVLLNLAGLLARAGDPEGGALAASSGERYGLSPEDAVLTHAAYAELYLGTERELAILRAGAERVLQSLAVWKQLIRREFAAGDADLARAHYQRALEYIEEDKELARIGQVTMGGELTADDLLEMPGIGDNPVFRQAAIQIGAYSELGDDAGLQQRVEALSRLIVEFPTLPVVQRYSVAQLGRLPLDPLVAAEMAGAALRNAPSDTMIMRAAGEAFLAAGNPEEAIRAVELWRANSLETAIISDVILANAMIQLDDLDAAEEGLEGLVGEAIATPTDPISRQILESYSFVRLKQGEDPAQTAARLEPLLENNQEVRIGIWLPLASGVVANPEIGAEWIRLAQAFDEPDDRLFLGNAWVTLAFTHERWDPEYANNALQLAQGVISEDPEGITPAVYSITSRAYRILAMGTDDPATRSSMYGRVVDELLAGAELQPGNPIPLLDAARFASDGMLYERSVRIYSQILALDLENDALEASVSNNMAMTMVRLGLDDSSGARASELVERSTGLLPEVPAHWGTRGWVELATAQPDAALDSFRKSVQFEGDNPEGWVGIAIASSQMGDTESDVYRRAIERVSEYAAEGRIDEELSGFLNAYGVTGWGG